MSVFFTSDTHFGHNREFLYAPRGFESIQEHDEEIIQRWNEVVGQEDTVYVLGDLMLNDNEHGMECLRRLNGHINILYGNHDTDIRKNLYATLPNATILDYATVIKINKYQFYLSHYPSYTSNLENDAPLSQHLINLYGHTHQKTNFFQDIPFMYHVGLDSHDCYPVCFEQIIIDIKNKISECQILF